MLIIIIKNILLEAEMADKLMSDVAAFIATIHSLRGLINDATRR